MHLETVTLTNRELNHTVQQQDRIKLDSKKYYEKINFITDRIDQLIKRVCWNEDESHTFAEFIIKFVPIMF